MTGPFLELIDISKIYPGVVALDHVSFAVWPGEVIGLIGAGLAWVAHKLTVQAELNLFELLRVRNELCADGVTRCAPASMAMPAR